MNNTLDFLRNEEKAVFSLRKIYQAYGYSQYKMNRFEEYDLYMQNKDFLVSDRVITFTDVNGKLLALKPDVTMSIINDTKDLDGFVHKFYYNENVYRASKGAYAFKEIMQAGLECIGDIDLYNISEVVFLAVKSLENIGEDYVLDVSHMGFIDGLLDSTGLSDNDRQNLIKLLGQKNMFAIADLLKNNNVANDISSKILKLVSCYGKIDDTLKDLEQININEKTDNALYELKSLCKNLKFLNCANKVSLDFSVVNNMNYYNGIVFNGYINNISQCVLSGGQYDKLMKKMNRKSQAIGFAIYLDLLNTLNTDKKELDADILIVYDKNDDYTHLLSVINNFTNQGKTVLAQKTNNSKIKCREAFKLENSVLKHLEVV